MFHSVCGSVGGFYCLNFQKFRYTSPLKPESLSLTKHSFRIREDLLDYKSAAIRRWHISWSQRRFVPKEIEKFDRLSERYWAVLRTSRLMNGKFFLLHISLVDLALLAWTEKVFRNSDGAYSASGPKDIETAGKFSMYCMSRCACLPLYRLKACKCITV